jgi:hypothetical protein
MAHPAKPKKRAVYEASVKLKPVHWDLLPDDRLGKSVWNATDEKHIANIFQEQGLWRGVEEMFNQQQGSLPRNDSGLGSSQSIAATKQQREISVLDAKRAYNMSIVLCYLI